MDFELSEEQQLLKQTAERFVADHCSFQQRRTQQGDTGWSPSVWCTLADLGLLALPFAEADGGLGLGPVETMIVMEAFGTGLLLEPYFATVILCGGLLRHAASSDQRAAWVPAIGAGELLMAFAHGERKSRYDLCHVEARAHETPSGFRLQGAKIAVEHGDSAHKLIVSARTHGNAADADGISLFLVDASASGVSRRGYTRVDGIRCADISFDDVEVGAPDSLGSPGAAAPVIARAIDEATAALCAEAIGIMAESLRLTVDYLKTRQQFGAPIGSFQALQHRAAEMFIALELARSMAMYATLLAVSENPRERRKAVSAAKIQVSRSLRVVGRQSIQLHGGNGMSIEYAIAHHFKRLTAIDALFGDEDHHLGLLMEFDATPQQA
jgi:pimeloyl-CoA dehydrogenase small subunit